jgi:hypothetical protein
MDRYRRRTAMLSVGAQLGCPLRRRIEGEIEIAQPVEIVFETTRSHAPTRFFFSRVLQPFGVNLAAKTVYQDMRRIEHLFRNSNHHNTIAKPERRMRRLLHGECPLERRPRVNPPPTVSAEYPWARAAHPHLDHSVSAW